VLGASRLNLFLDLGGPSKLVPRSACVEVGPAEAGQLLMAEILPSAG